MAKNAFTFLPAKLAEGLITMAITFFYTDLFTESAYGSYQIINTTVLFLYLIVVGWLANASTRYVSDCIAKKEEKTFFSTVSVCYLTIILVALAASLAGALIWKNSVIPLTAAMFAAYALFQVLNGMLVQTGKIKASVSLSLADVLIKLGGAYLYVNVLSGGASTPRPAMLAMITADLFAGLAAVFVLKIPKFFAFKSFSKDQYKAFLSYGLPLLGFSISVSFLNLADRFLVTFIKGTEAFAVYSANNSISSGLFTLIMAGIMRGVYPAVIKGYREGGKDEAQFLLDRGVRLYLLVAAPCAAGLLAVGPRLSEVFFTKESYHHGIIIGIAALAMFFMGLTEYANKAWELTKNTKPVLQNSIAAAAIKIAATLALIYMFGIIGAVIGSLIAFGSYFIIGYARARKVFAFKLNPASTAKIIISALLCAGGALACIRLLPIQNGIINLAASVLIGAVIYVVCLTVCGEVKEELAKIKKFLTKRGAKN